VNLNINRNRTSLVGIAIATFNRKERLKECLEAVNRSTYKNILISVVDDGSSDGTWEMLNTYFPKVERIRGDGNLWWAGATNKAIKKCLDLGCEFVVLLNDDCMIAENTISKFIKRSEEFPKTVIAPVTLDIKSPGHIWWAGSSWGGVKFLPFIWLIRQKYPHHTPVSALPNSPYSTSEFTGRAIFIPKSIFDRFGLIDSKLFPQYGSDNDLSLRITTGGGRAIVDPSNRVFLYTEEAGQNTSGNLLTLPIRFFKLLFYRKHGEAARFWWHILKRYAPWYAVIPSYIFILTLTFLRVFKILPIVYRIIGRKNSNNA
jgi:GT2 family glycosyltransferase